MRKISFSVIAVASLLIGCATMSDVQLRCEQKHSAFGDMVSCLKSGVAAERRLRRDDLVRIYTATADLLVEEVGAGRISEAAARLKLANLFSQMKSKDESARGASLDRLSKQLQKMGDDMRPANRCRQVGNAIMC